MTNRVFAPERTHFNVLGEESIIGYKPFKFSIWKPLTIMMIRTRQKKFVFLITLESGVKPKFFSNFPIDPTRLTPAELIKNIKITGGALAEYLSDHYGDSYDPDYVANKTEETFKKMMVEIDRQGYLGS